MKLAICNEVWRNESIETILRKAAEIGYDGVEIAPPAGFRMVGQKIPRLSPRFSGRTAISANITVHEPAPPDDPDCSEPSHEGPPDSAV